MFTARSGRTGANARRHVSLCVLDTFVRLWRNRRGSAYVLTAVVTVPLIGFIGLSADAGRAYLVKARLSSSVDAAALAAGKSVWDPDFEKDAIKYFNSNFPPGFLGADVGDPKVEKVKSLVGGEVVKVSASAQVPTSFMQLFGFDHLTVSAEAEVTRKNTALDVVLSIDMSGSMASWSGSKKKIDAARDAAKTLVEILYGEENYNPLLKIGLVPWNANVNVMEDTGNASPLSKWKPNQTRKQNRPSFRHPVTGQWQNHVWKINNSPVLLLDKPDTDWKGCVFARYLNDGSSDNDADDDLAYVTDQGWYGWEPREHGGNSCWSCSPCLKHGIFPLVQDKRKTLQAIDNLKEPQGNTVIPQGLVWAWRVLINEAPFTGGSEDDPDRPLIRAVVLLSDGANCAARGDAYKEVWGGCGSYSTRKMNERALVIADKMKREGVVIYTIQFGFDDPESADLLKSVASSRGAPHYHYAPDSSALERVFAEIGNSLSELRISK